MKNSTTYQRIVLIGLFLCLIITAVAQDLARVQGQVFDEAGKPMVGVSVRLVGSPRSVSTDIDGRYLLQAESTTAASLEFSYIGYATKQITGITLSPKDVTPLTVVLALADSKQLEQVVITASFKKESINALYMQRKNAISISDGISTEQIQRSPDRNTSEVLKRINGASIQENKFVIVRGLSDRYNTAMLNNGLLPNTEVDKRAFSFDILPANLIETIIVHKSARPDLPADFSGGIVQVLTKDFPASDFLQATLGTSVNSQSTFKDFLSPTRAKSELFGKYAASRGIPADFPSREAFQALPNSAAETFDYSRKFSNNWGYYGLKTSLTPNFQVNYGTTKQYKEDAKFGVNLALSYRYDQRLKQSDQRAYVGESLGDVFSDKMYNYNTNIGAVANFAYGWKQHKITWKNLYNRILENQFTHRTGMDDSGGEFIRTGDYLLQRSILSNQLTGDHLLSSSRGIKLDWSLQYGRVNRDEPGYKRMDYSTDGQASVQPGSAVASLAGNFNSRLLENTYGGALNLQVPLRLFSPKDQLKVGYFAQFRDRQFAARVLGFIRNGDFDTSLLRLPIDRIFEEGNIRPNGFVLNEITNGGDQYTANARLNAGYVMYDIQPIDPLRIVFGARLESYRLQLSSEVNGSAIQVDTTTLSLLPSLNVIYQLDSKQSLRLAASQTLGRPEFRELAPFPFYDFNKNVNVRGNNNLKQSSTLNVDLGYAYYPTAGETLSIGGFYKKFQNPIEQSLQLGTSGRSLGYINSREATVYGVEAEVRKNLKFIHEGLENFVFSANGSYIKSTVLVATTVNASGKRPMQGQSPYLINSGISYSSKQANSSSFTLLYNRIGPRIWAIGNVQDPDIYEYARNVLDLQFSQKFAKSRAEFKINCSDILNNPAYFYQKPRGANPQAGFDRNTDNINIKERYGRTISATISYRFL